MVIVDYGRTFTFFYTLPVFIASKTVWFCIQLELEKVKKRRLEREREKEERDQEQEMMQRDKELDYFREWEKQEDTVHFSILSFCFNLWFVHIDRVAIKNADES